MSDELVYVVDENDLIIRIESPLTGAKFRYERDHGYDINGAFIETKGNINNEILDLTKSAVLRLQKAKLIKSID